MMWVWITEMVICFGIVFGLGIHALVATLKEGSREQAQR